MLEYPSSQLRRPIAMIEAPMCRRSILSPLNGLAILEEMLESSRSSVICARTYIENIFAEVADHPQEI